MGIASSEACQTPKECRNAYAKLFANWRKESIKREKRKLEIITKYGGQPYPHLIPIPPYAPRCFPTELQKDDKHLNNLASWLSDISRIQKEIPKDCSEKDWERKTSQSVAQRTALEYAIEYCEKEVRRSDGNILMVDIIKDWISGCHTSSSACDTSFMSRGNEFVIQQANSIPLNYSFRIDKLVKQAFDHLGFTANGQPLAQASLF